MSAGYYRICTARGINQQQLAWMESEISDRFGRMRRWLLLQMTDINKNLPLTVQVQYDDTLEILHDLEHDLVGRLMQAEDHV